MYLKHLVLHGFRNYQELELELLPGLVVLYGENGQGKSNLLETVYLLALTRSHRAEKEREVIRFQSLEDLPYTRVSGLVRRQDNSEVEVQVDMALPPPGAVPGLSAGEGHLQKRIRVDGVPKLASEAVGTFSAVLFSAEDIALITGPPAGRRRFLDILTSQVDRGYLRSLQGYQRVLTQRNHLLRRLKEGTAKPQELDFWDGELCTHGACIIQGRRQVVEAMAPLTARSYQELAGSGETLEVRYLPALESANSLSSELAEQLQQRLQELRPREIQAGQTLVGPHRDELLLLLDGREVGAYGSRGQTRSVALVLRLAEADLLAQRLGEEPVLLLDDVLSELDLSRQEQVLERACQAQQALMTMVELTQHPWVPERAVALLRVHNGNVSPGAAVPKA